MKRENVINNISFIIGVITVLMAVYWQKNIVLVGIICGIGGFLYGICQSFIANKIGYILSSIGGSLATSLSLYKFNILDKGDSFTFMICFSIFLLMLLYLIFDSLNRKKTFSIYSLAVEAEVVDLVRNPNTKREFYQPIYSYKIDDVEYEVSALGYIDKFIPKLGDKIKIFVDPNNYEKVYFDKSLYNKIYDSGLCLFLLIASFIIIVSLFI